MSERESRAGPEPLEGGKVELWLEAAGSDGARYRATLTTAEGARNGAVRVDARGSTTFEPWQPSDPPRWLADVARALVRAEWRARAGRADAPDWPRRIARWRAEPEPRGER
ncbi:MAG: hypothetical protein U0263_21465 [Polyangiaceae bacterium]